MLRRRFLMIAPLLALAGCNRKSVAERAEDYVPPGEAEIQKNHAAGEAFLKKNATEPGVMTTATGLQYKVVREGPAGGVHPTPDDEVRVNYEGTLLDGTVFDSSYRSGMPAVFVLGRLIPGWIEGIQLMKPGDEFLLYVPSVLAYGDADTGRIPPGSTLVFKIELLGVLQKNAGGGLG